MAFSPIRRRKQRRARAAAVAVLLSSFVLTATGLHAQAPPSSVPCTARPPASRMSPVRVRYPAGWNLIGGQPGSCLHGATALFLLGVNGGDVRLIEVPAEGPLPGGATNAFWAYFPVGGSLELTYGFGPDCTDAQSSAGHSFFFVPVNTWWPKGNTTPVGSAQLQNASSVRLLLWDQAKGYQDATEIPAGYAGWVLPRGIDGSSVPPVEFSYSIC